MRHLTPPLGVVLAPPLWSISAEHSAEHMRLVRHQHAAQRAIDELVTKHPVPYLADPVTASARTLERLATSKGMTTRMHVGLESCTLEGRLGDQRLGFRAHWRRGKADSAFWYEPTEQWATVADTRPVGIAKLTRTTLAGHRSPGCDTRSYLVSSPRGVLIPFAQVTARVKALG